VKAFVIDRYGKTDPMRLADVPDPQMREDDVLIEIHAASVNPLDVKIKAGEFKRILPKRFPLVLGHDLAGVVTRVGSRVQAYKVGDEVYARPSDRRVGTFAEAIAVNERDVALKPKSLTMQEAASIPLVGLTAWQALVDRAAVKSGQRIFVQAGSGGVGTMAIQLAKHLGATVATTTSTANVDFVKGLGADVVVDYKTQDFARELRDYDVVLHSGDKTALEKSVGVLNVAASSSRSRAHPIQHSARTVDGLWSRSAVCSATASAKRRNSVASTTHFCLCGRTVGSCARSARSSMSVSFDRRSIGCFHSRRPMRP
jgi:alcohol dehydrogenase